MAVAHVQSTGVSSSGSVASVSKAFTSNVTSGNFLAIVGISDDANDGGNSAANFSSSPSNTFSYSVSSPSEHVNSSYVTSAASGSTTITFTPDTGAYCGLAIAEFSGVDATPADGTPAGNTDNTTNPTTSNITTTAAGLLIAAVRVNSGRAMTEDSGSGWNLIYEDETWSAIAANIAYRITSGSGTYSHTWTSALGGWWATIAGYKEGAGGGGPKIPIYYHHYQQQRIA